MVVVAVGVNVGVEVDVGDGVAVGAAPPPLPPHPTQSKVVVHRNRVGRRFRTDLVWDPFVMFVLLRLPPKPSPLDRRLADLYLDLNSPATLLASIVTVGAP
jgi:hypothetical protein